MLCAFCHSYSFSKYVVYSGGDILNGRVAIVTGASSGIGRAIGVALAKAGMKVIIFITRVQF